MDSPYPKHRKRIKPSSEGPRGRTPETKPTRRGYMTPLTGPPSRGPDWVSRDPTHTVPDSIPVGLYYNPGLGTVIRKRRRAPDLLSWRKDRSGEGDPPLLEGGLRPRTSPDLKTETPLGTSPPRPCQRVVVGATEEVSDDRRRREDSTTSSHRQGVRLTGLVLPDSGPRQGGGAQDVGPRREVERPDTPRL